MVVVDLVGFGIVMPILPFYAQDFGASATLLGGLFTAYAAAQFVCAPLWGRLSDRIGRRRVMLLTIAGTVFALGVASVIARLKSGVGLIRTLCYLPSLAPPVAATLVFFMVLRPNGGPVDNLLGVFGIDSPLWFSDPAWAKPGITAIMLWISGDLMIIILAAILDVPQEQYEAAELDGAGPIRREVDLGKIEPLALAAALVLPTAGGQAEDLERP